MSIDSWARDERRFALPRLLPRRLRSLHTVALVLVIALIGWLGWIWYRSSSFVKVEHVTVTGLSGPDVNQIRGALTDAALQMTTLNMQTAKLESAVDAYAYVRSLTVSRDGAHGVTIHVSELVPVATIDVGGRDEAVDGSGQVLQSTTIPHGELPSVPLRSDPFDGRVTAAGARSALAVLAAAPYALLAHVQAATSSAKHGVIVTLRNGPELYFGPATELALKWKSVVAVLQNSDSAGAAYIDVTDPVRPAAGVSVTNQQAAALGLAAASTTTSSTSATTTSP